MNLQTRSATAEDEPFLRELFASSRAATFSYLPLPTEQKSALIEMQYRARQQHYRSQFPDAAELVIEVDSQPVGALYLHRGSNAWRILDISVLERNRNRGIGTLLLKRIILDASSQVLLSVEAQNPAKKLYERLGFQEVSSDGFFLEMVHPGLRPL